MLAVEAGETFDLVSPKTDEVMKTVDARNLWSRILTTRVETGEPYILYSDTTNRALPEHQKANGFEVVQSNLCAEITLPTGLDYNGRERTAVCCLSSLNVEHFEDWKDSPMLIPDIMSFLDNVLSDFIRKTEGVKGFENARYSALMERSVGLGVMGLHSYLQRNSIPFEGVMAKVQNRRIFHHIRKEADAASVALAESRGPCPDAERQGVMERFSNKMAVAPTASISIIAGNSSPGIEPRVANSFTQKTLSGSFPVRNPHLTKVLEQVYDSFEGQYLLSRKSWLEDVWSSIITNEGSVQHLEFLSEHDKEVFRTAFEIDQRWIIELAGDRAPFICQAQSVNLFLPADSHKRDIHGLHWMAWKLGLKSLYYCRSKSIQRPDVVKHSSGTMPTEAERPDVDRIDYDECLSCQ